MLGLKLVTQKRWANVELQLTCIYALLQQDNERLRSLENRLDRLSLDRFSSKKKPSSKKARLKKRTPTGKSTKGTK